MNRPFEELVEAAGLQRIASQIHEAAMPSVGMQLEPNSSQLPLAASKLGGNPDLPSDFSWPKNKDRPLDYLLQINLAESRSHDQQNLLPTSGLLTFLYDLNDQPWGFDPADLNGFRVIYTPDLTNLKSHDIPDNEFSLPECSICFQSMLTIPHFGSRSGDSFFTETKLTDDETDTYFDLCEQIECVDSATEGAGNHHLLGHSSNIQGDMQLEAQLVTNGLYCGDATGYEDPRCKTLDAGADDWLLLLQLDSDDGADIMWGDCGMLYYWIRKEDLAQQRFENVWMTLQCC